MQETLRNQNAVNIDLCFTSSWNQSGHDGHVVGPRQERLPPEAVTEDFATRALPPPPPMPPAAAAPAAPEAPAVAPVPPRASKEDAEPSFPKPFHDVHFIAFHYSSLYTYGRIIILTIYEVYLN